MSIIYIFQLKQNDLSTSSAALGIIGTFRLGILFINFLQILLTKNL